MDKLFLNYEVDVNVKRNLGSALIVAIRNMDTKMIEWLLTNGADIKDDPMVLFTSVKNGILKIVEDLLEEGTDVNMIDSSYYTEGLTLLHSAVKRKKVEMAKLLINYGANVNVKDSLGITPLVVAIRNKHTEMIELLLTNGADTKDDPMVLCAAVKNGILKIVEDLLKEGTDVNMIDSSYYTGGLTLLYSAVKGKQVNMAKLLINYGANVNVRDSLGTTPLVLAIRNRDRKMAKLLLINGAEIKRDPKVLCTAVENGSLKMVEDLLKYGADVNASDQFGRAALHYTVLYRRDNACRLTSCYNNLRYKEIAELLLSKGANVNIETKSGITTLFAASRQGYEDIVETLLKYGAECNPGAGEGTKPLHAAAVGGNWKITENLLKFGAKVDSRDIYGRTALHFASRGRCYQIVKSLLEYGSDVNIISKKNHTPLEYSRLVADFAYNDDYHYYLHNNENLFYTNDSPTTKLLIQHIALVKAAGLYVSERNLQWINNNYKIHNFMNDCEAEIEILKTEKINATCASFYDILTKDTSKLAKNESIVQAMKCCDYKTKFPIYANTIDSRFKRGVEREELQEQVIRNKFLHSLFENLPELPFLCTEKIFSYLSDHNLRILLVACKPLD